MIDEFYKRWQTLIVFADAKDLLNDTLKTWDLFYYSRKEAESIFGCVSYLFAVNNVLVVI